MPIVGEAVIRVRVIGDRLNTDISRAVRQGVNGAGPDIDRAGEAAGQRFNQSFQRSVRSGNSQAERTGAESGRATSRGLLSQIERDRPAIRRGFGRTASDAMRSFKDEFNLGIGAARMGPAIIGALTLAGPSILSGVGALGSAIGAQLVSQIAAAAPALAGAGGLAAAGVATLALNVGLLMAAFKSGNAELDAAVKQFKELGTILGAPIAAGMTEGFSKFVASLQRVLPQINDLLEDTGRAFGEVFDKLGQTIERGDNLSRLRDILATNTTFVRNFGDGLSGLTTSFLILMRAAQPFIDFLGDAVKRFGEWAEASLATAEANGTLATFMDTLLAKAREFGNAITDFAIGLYNIGKAAAPAAASLSDIAANFRAWTENPENQSKMLRFFEKMHTLASGLGKLIGQLFSAAGNALADMDLSNILAIMEIIGTKWGPAIAEIFGQISKGAGDNLVTFFDNLGETLKNIADSGVMEAVARWFSSILKAVSELARKLSENPIGAKILAIAAGFALFGGILSPVFSVLKLLIPVFSALGGAMSLPVLVAIAIAAAFIFVYTQSKKLRDAITELGEQIWEKLKVIWEFLEPALGRLWEAVKRLATAIGDFLAPVFKALGPILSFLVGLLGVLLVAVVNFLTLAADFVTGWLTGDWQPFIDDFLAIVDQAKQWWDTTFMPWWNELWQKVEDWAKQKWEELKAFLAETWENIKLLAQQKWDEFGTWLATLWPRIITWAVLQWEAFKAWLSQLWTDLVLWGMQKWDEFKLWLDGLWPAIVVWAALQWETFKQWLSQKWTDTVLFGMQKWDEFKLWLDGLWPQIVVWAALQWETFKQWLSQKWTDTVLFGMQKWDEFKTWLHGLWPQIVVWAALQWETFKTWLAGLWSDIVSDAQKWWEDFKSKIEGIVNGLIASLQVIFGGLLTTLAALWGGIAVAASLAWEGVKNAIVGPIEAAWHRVEEVAGFISGIISGLLGNVNADLVAVNSSVQEAVAGAAAASAAAATSAAAGTTSTGLPPKSKIESFFGQLAASLATVEIPFGGALARGGTVPAVAGGQMFQLGEAGRRERVEPLDSQGLSTRDRALIAMIVKSMLPQKVGSGGTSVSVRIGERELTDIVTDVSAARDDALARRARLRR